MATTLGTATLLQLVITGSPDTSQLLWDVTTAAEVCCIKTSHSGQITEKVGKGIYARSLY